MCSRESDLARFGRWGSGSVDMNSGEVNEVLSSEGRPRGEGEGELSRSMTAYNRSESLS